MQTTLVTITPRQDKAWARAATRECIRYKEHGEYTEVQAGKTVCWNCGGSL